MPEPFSDTLDKKAKGCKKKDTRAAVAEEGKISEWKLRGYRAVKNKAVEVLGQQDADNLMLKIRHDEIKLNKAKRYLSQAEHKKKREVAKKSTPDIEEVRKNLHCCSMQDLLGKVRGLDAIVTDPPYPKEYVGLFGELAKLAKKALKPDGVLAVMIGESYLPEILADMTAHMKYRTVMAYLTPGPATALWGNANCNSQFKLILVFGGEKRMRRRWPADRCNLDIAPWSLATCGQRRLKQHSKALRPVGANSRTNVAARADAEGRDATQLFWPLRENAKTQNFCEPETVCRFHSRFARSDRRAAVASFSGFPSIA
jgi:16S rRNA G966 N2-methylase RsmD